MYYNIGKLNPDSDHPSLSWLATGSMYGRGYIPSVMVDNFGVVMEVHTLDNKVCYRVGSLEENYILWHGDIGEHGTILDDGIDSTITSMPVGRNIIAVSYQSHGNLYMASMAFGTEITSLTFQDAIEQGAVQFGQLVTEFNNDGPTTITQDWAVEETYSSSDTYNWESQTHVGVTATVEVGFFGGGGSVSAETSVTMTVGESTTISKEFVMNTTIHVELPPQAGKVKFIAELYRVPTQILFSANFKRGDSGWTENETVDVSHGLVYANVSSLPVP